MTWSVNRGSTATVPWTSERERGREGEWGWGGGRHTHKGEVGGRDRERIQLTAHPHLLFYWLALHWPEWIPWEWSTGQSSFWRTCHGIRTPLQHKITMTLLIKFLWAGRFHKQLAPPISQAHEHIILNMHIHPLCKCALPRGRCESACVFMLSSARHGCRGWGWGRSYGAAAKTPRRQWPLSSQAGFIIRHHDQRDLNAEESTKGLNQSLTDRPELPKLTLTWHASKHKLRNLQSTSSGECVFTSDHGYRKCCVTSKKKKLY